MMHIIPIALTVLLYGSAYPRMTDKCRDSAMTNGAGYAAHNTDCDKFIQCQYTSNGDLQGQVRQCAFATFWNNDLLTCVSANHVTCHTDKCQGQFDGMRYPGNGNCRGYWSCMGGKSVPMCCPPGHKYDVILGCVHNHHFECLDQCFNDLPQPEPESEPEVQACDNEPVFGNRHVYRVKVSGLLSTLMHCPMGTLYDHEECGCTHFEPVKSPRKECRKELHLTFDTDEMDQSGNRNHVVNQNVTIKDGVAKFNGMNSKLIVPRFNNIEHTDTLIIRIKYSSNHMSSGYARALVSNSDCLNIPSIMLCEDDVNTYFGVSTTNSQFAYMHLAHHSTNNKWTMSEKQLEYKFTDGTLQGSDGYRMTSRPAPGYIRNVHCALHVGYAETLSPFEGEIDELEIFLCDPDV